MSVTKIIVCLARRDHGAACRATGRRHRIVPGVAALVVAVVAPCAAGGVHRDALASTSLFSGGVIATETVSGVAGRGAADAEGQNAR
jgi:hypothetical protein